MLKFIRKHDKQLLAIVGVFLMISFVATLGPTKCDNNSNLRNQDTLLTTINGREVHQHDVALANAEWDLVRQRVLFNTGQTGPQQWQPLVFQILAQNNPNLPYLFLQQLRDNPELYALLQIEAQQMGVAPQTITADGMLTDQRVAIQLEDGRVVPFSDLNDVYRKDQFRQATANFMMVMTAFRRPMDAVKISHPMIRMSLGEQLQLVKLRVVDFPVKDFEAQVTAPTDDQLKAHFEKYADNLPEAISNTNTFGFGYRYPNRVKVQYLSIPRSEVRKAVEATRSEYDWNVEANKYYLQHQAEFTPTTKPATQEAFVLAPTSAPTVKPFAEVREQILTRLIDPLIDRLSGQIQTELASRLNADFETAKNAGATSNPSSMPASKWSPNFEYLQNLAQEFQTRHKVTLTVASVADSFKTADDLAALPGIGQVSDFVAMATENAEAFVPEDQKSASTTMPLYKPSKPLFDSTRNVYFFRLTAAEASHKPASLDEVRAKVEADVKRQQAFEKARAAAQQLVDSAKNDRNGFGEGSADRKATVLGPMTLNSSIPIENYTVSQRGEAALMTKAFELLTDLAKNKSTTQPSTTAPSGPPEAGPMAVVELAGDARVTAVELISVESRLDAQTMELFATRFGDEIAQPFRTSIMANWFNFDNVAQRLGYTPPEGSRTRRTVRASAG